MRRDFSINRKEDVTCHIKIRGVSEKFKNQDLLGLGKDNTRRNKGVYPPFLQYSKNELSMRGL
jgi:hypothetical protein